MHISTVQTITIVNPQDNVTRHVIIKADMKLTRFGFK